MCSRQYHTNEYKITFMRVNDEKQKILPENANVLRLNIKSGRTMYRVRKREEEKRGKRIYEWKLLAQLKTTSKSSSLRVSCSY